MNIEILIIDDNSDIRNLIKDLIIEEGYKTRVATNYNGWDFGNRAYRDLSRCF